MRMVRGRHRVLELRVAGCRREDPNTVMHYIDTIIVLVLQ